VAAAYAVGDVLSLVAPLLRRYPLPSGEGALEISCARALDTPSETRAWALDLTTRNMRELYERTWGWDERAKRAELEDAAAVLVVAREEGGARRLVAFAHVRFEYEELKGAPVLYLYELQCEAAWQGQGVGRFLMVLLQLLAAKLRLPWILLTVFKSTVSPSSHSFPSHALVQSTSARCTSTRTSCTTR